MAAPLGFKTFTTGDVLTAADTNGYLMQGVWTFADAAARDAAVTSPEEGNMCYLKDTDALQSYSGTAWVSVGGAPGFVGCTAFRTNSNLAVNSGVATAVTMTSESFDTDGFHDNVTNTSRMTIPSGKNGKYLLVGSISFDTVASFSEIRWYKNGSVIPDGLLAGIVNRNSGGVYGNGATILVDAVATDYFEMFANQSNTNVQLQYARFSIIYLGA